MRLELLSEEQCEHLQELGYTKEEVNEMVQEEFDKFFRQEEDANDERAELLASRGNY